MTQVMKTAAILGWVAAALLGAGCGTLGDVMEPAPGPAPGEPTVSEVRGEVVSVDPRAEVIELDRTAEATPYATKLRRQDETVRIAYTSQTTVTYQGRRYSPADLEPGDLVVASIGDEVAGLPVADRIVVEASVQDRGGRQDVVRGEVQEVESWSNELAVVSDGETVWMSYEDETPVTYEGREYRVEQLEAGDLVEVRVERSGSDELEARSIQVITSVQDRDGRSTGAGRVETYEGSVSWVDTRAGQFGLDVAGFDVLRVTIPFSADAETRQVFERLRRGERLRIDALPVDGDTVELVRFR